MKLLVLFSFLLGDDVFCSEGTFRCPNELYCYTEAQRCDGEMDCLHASLGDEANCPVPGRSLVAASSCCGCLSFCWLPPENRALSIVKYLTDCEQHYALISQCIEEL